jgi:GTP-binding protein
MRKKRKIYEVLEFLSVKKALSFLKKSEIVILVCDAKIFFTNQDRRIANLSLKYGNSIILVINKWDYVYTRVGRAEKRVQKEMLSYIKRHFSFLNSPPVFFISALHNKGIKDLTKFLKEVKKEREKRISTPELNSFLQFFQKKYSPPSSLKITYITQVDTSPPKIVLFIKGNTYIPRNYLTLLERQIKKKFLFRATPVFFKVQR